MADLKISQLTPALSVTGPEVIPAVQEGANKSVTAAQIAGLVTLSSLGAATAAQGGLAETAIQPGADLADFTSGAATSGQVPTADGAGGVAWAAIPVTEPINYQEATANVTIDWSNGPVQYLYVNPAGASIQITLPADPGALSQAGILFVKNNTGKAHTWATSPAIRFVGETDADTVPTPAAVTFWTRYTVQWNDYAAAWYVTLAGKDTA
ncbi:MAG: hypothetical protein KA142_11915 [Chromatiaceae bacterium]|nr:hypothetical protein [Chromatiaceae bacterium]